MANSEILQDFLGELCGCGKPKRTRQSFCRECYLRLPFELKQRLNRKFGEGYEEAFADAREYLSLD
jgi:hypothetical protein